MTGMRRILPGVAFAMMLVSAAAAQAQKVGFINIQRAIAESNEGKQAAKDLQAKFGPKGQELQKQQQELMALQDQLRNQEKTLAEDARTRLLRQIDDKTRAFNRSNEDFQAETQAAEQEAINTIGQKMLQVLREFREKNGYTVILDSQVVVDADPAADVTNAVVEAYNAAHAKPAASTTTPASPAPAAAAPAAPGATP